MGNTPTSDNTEKLNMHNSSLPRIAEEITDNEDNKVAGPEEADTPMKNIQDRRFIEQEALNDWHIYQETNSPQDYFSAEDDDVDMSGSPKEGQPGINVYRTQEVYSTSSGSSGPSRPSTSTTPNDSSTSSSSHKSQLNVSPEWYQSKKSNSPASNSFDEQFKYKVSIYSKVSGCRMTNLPDYTIVKQIRVVILEYITVGNPHEAIAVKFAYEKMKNGGLQIITDDLRLAEALGKLTYFACIPIKMTFPNSPRVVGFVKDLPIDMEPADLKREIRKLLPEVYSVRYITEKAAGRSRPCQRPCAFISFNLRYLPRCVRVYGRDYEVQVPNPMQCTKCCRYGHQGKQCRAEVRCSLCAGRHSKQLCTSGFLRCVNCKTDHPSTSHECEVWQQGKLMNELRYRGGMSAEEAIDVATDGKIQHKKHSFVSPDEYFDNLESFCLENGDGSDEDTLHTSNPSPPGHSNSSPEESVNESRRAPFNPQFLESQKFLDIMTNFFLKLANPEEDFNSSILMPGLEDDSLHPRAGVRGVHKINRIAEQFKYSVLKSMAQEEEEEKASPGNH